MTLDPRAFARALGGEATGRNVLAPGPGHSQADRSLSVKIDSADSLCIRSPATTPLHVAIMCDRQLGLPSNHAGASDRCPDAHG